MKLNRIKETGVEAKFPLTGQLFRHSWQLASHTYLFWITVFTLVFAVCNSAAYGADSAANKRTTPERFYLCHYDKTDDIFKLLYLPSNAARGHERHQDDLEPIELFPARIAG